MILLINWTKRRSLAHFRASGRFFLETSTKEGILFGAGPSAYPRIGSVYTIRTPSPNGQTDLAQFRLPVFFHCGAPSLARILSDTNMEENRSAAAATNKKGYQTCKSQRSLWRWRPVSALLPAVTQSASRRLAALRLARALPWCSMKTSAKARQSAQPETCFIVNCTRSSATNATLQTPQSFKAARMRPARLFASLGALSQSPDLPKKDTQCSTRS